MFPPVCHTCLLSELKPYTNRRASLPHVCHQPPTSSANDPDDTFINEHGNRRTEVFISIKASQNILMETGNTFSCANRCRVINRFFSRMANLEKPKIITLHNQTRTLLLISSVWQVSPRGTFAPSSGPWNRQSLTNTTTRNLPVLHSAILTINQI